MAAKMSKKELKEPDFLQVEFAKVTDLIVRHRMKLYVILALHLLGLAIASGWYLYRAHYNKSALKLYSQVETSALQKDKQIDQAKLLAGYKKVVAQYPRSPAALHSLYMQGNLYLSMNQIDPALAAYDEFLHKASGKDYLSVLAHAGKGYGYEVKKDYKNALAAFDQALQADQGKIFAGQLYRDKGRIYEALHDRPKALEYYRQSLEKTKDPTVEMILKRKIAELS